MVEALSGSDVLDLSSRSLRNGSIKPLETTLTIREIAQRLRRGSWKSLNNMLYLAAKAARKEEPERAKPRSR